MTLYYFHFSASLPLSRHFQCRHSSLITTAFDLSTHSVLPYYIVPLIVLIRLYLSTACVWVCFWLCHIHKMSADKLETNSLLAPEHGDNSHCIRIFYRVHISHYIKITLMKRRSLVCNYRTPNSSVSVKRAKNVQHKIMCDIFIHFIKLCHMESLSIWYWYLKEHTCICICI